MHLALFVTADGIHHGGWRHPAARSGAVGFDFYQGMAEQAEAACLDMMFVADKLAIDDIYGGSFDTTIRYRARQPVEPLTLLAALAVTTRKIGLGGTISTSYTEPYHVARMFAAIDQLSGGRAAWNAVTSVSDSEARNFGREEHFDHTTRYDRAAEYIEVVRQLWDTGDAGTAPPNKATGEFADPGNIRYADHRGPWFEVRGPLAMPQSPQGRPVLIQAGASGAFLELAARNAEVTFAVYPNLERAVVATREFRSLVAAAGRPQSAVKILPGLVPIVADSDDEAADLMGELDALILPLAGLSFMSGSMNYDLSRHPVDGLVPDIRDLIKGSKGRFHYVIGKAIDEGWTMGELGRWYASSLSFAKMVGSAKTVADAMEQWVGSGACDGFVIMPAFMPDGPDPFLTKVVPILQSRRLFRTQYSGTTLRDHLNLPPMPHRAPRLVDDPMPSAAAP